MEVLIMKTKSLNQNPVLSLQVMLRSLSDIYDFLPPVPLDGIFSDITLEAVLLYQKEKFPPATGIVDQALWDTLRNDVAQNKETLIKPKVLRAYPESGDPLVFGEERSEIALFQLMFQLLDQKILGIQEDPPTGIFTLPLKENINWLQAISGLPITDQLDPKTWDRLARLYELYITKV